MSNHAHRRPDADSEAEPPVRGGFIRRMIRFFQSGDGGGSTAVGFASSRVEAELMAGYLRSNGVKAVVAADDEGGLNPALQGAQRVRVLVPNGQHAGARKLLNERD